MAGDGSWYDEEECVWYDRHGNAFPDYDGAFSRRVRDWEVESNWIVEAQREEVKTEETEEAFYRVLAHPKDWDWVEIINQKGEQLLAEYDDPSENG